MEDYKYSEEPDDKARQEFSENLINQYGPDVFLFFII